jgi:signal peptidase II
MTPFMVDPRAKAYGTAAAIVALDRLTKWWIEGHVSFIDTYRVIPGFFDIIHSENRGVAFGLFNDSTSEWRTTLLILGALVAVVAVGIMLWKPERLDPPSRWGLVLVMGGAAGNLFDRILWGRVTDFLLFYIGRYQWPAFNVADSAVVIGSGLLVIDLIRPKRRTAHVS